MPWPGQLPVRSRQRALYDGRPAQRGVWRGQEHDGQQGQAGPRPAADKSFLTGVPARRCGRAEPAGLDHCGMALPWTPGMLRWTSRPRRTSEGSSLMCRRSARTAKRRVRSHRWRERLVRLRRPSIVVPDGGGEGEDSLQDSDCDSAGGVAAVGFEVELSFESVVDRLDDLAEGLEEPGAGPFRCPRSETAQPPARGGRCPRPARSPRSR